MLDICLTDVAAILVCCGEILHVDDVLQIWKLEKYQENKEWEVLH